MSHGRSRARCLVKEARADVESVELARNIAPSMYLRLSEGVDEPSGRSLSTSFRVAAGFLSFLVLLIGPLALSGFAQARGRHHSAHHLASLVLARKSDSGGGDDHASGDSHGDNHQGDNQGDGHNAVLHSAHSRNAQPVTHNSANKAGTANTKNHSQNAGPATHNSVNKAGTANTNQSQNAGPATQNSVNKVGTANTNQSQNAQR